MTAEAATDLATLSTAEKRLRALTLRDRGTSQRQICEILRCSSRDVNRWLRAYGDRRTHAWMGGVVSTCSWLQHGVPARLQRQLDCMGERERALMRRLQNVAMAALFLSVGIIMPAHGHSWYSPLTVPADAVAPPPVPEPAPRGTPGPTIYDNMRSPLTGTLCCGGTDCGPAPYCVTGTNADGLWVHGKCRVLPWDKVLAMPSPDGESHACFVNGEIRCVILGGWAKLLDHEATKTAQR